MLTCATVGYVIRYERSALLQDMGLRAALVSLRPRVAIFGGTSNWSYQQHRTNLLCEQLHKDVETAKYVKRCSAVNLNAARAGVLAGCSAFRDRELREAADRALSARR